VETAQSFKYRIDPTPAQQTLLWSTIGGSRFAYNHLLGLVKDNWAQVRAEKQASADGETHTTEYVSTNHFGLLYLWADVRDKAAVGAGPWCCGGGPRLDSAARGHRPPGTIRDVLTLTPQGHRAIGHRPQGRQLTDGEVHAAIGPLE
jgi:hypothetical protein